MKTKLLFFCCIFSIQCFAQNWQAVGEGLGFGGTSVHELFEFNNKLFVGGNFSTVANRPTSGLAFWNGVNWIPFISSEGFSLVESFSCYEGELYGFARFSGSSGQFLQLVKHNERENNWSTVPNTEVSQKLDNGEVVSGAIYKTIVFENELYVIGSFDEIGGKQINNIAKWNGSSWSALLGENFSIAYFGFLSDMIVYNDELIICGITLATNGGEASNVAKWNNGNWDILNGGLINNATGFYHLYDLEIFQGDLYIGGAGSKASVNDIGYELHKLNGSSWEGVAGFEQEEADFTTSGITALKTFGEFLFLAKGLYSQTLLYDGNSIRKIEEDLNNVSFGSNSIQSFEVLNKELYVGGYFYGGDGPTGVARLGNLVSKDSTEVEEVCTLFPNPSSGVFMVSYPLNNNSGVVIRIYDITGKLFLEERFNDFKGDHVRSLNLSGLLKGNYIVNVISKEFNETKILVLNSNN